LGRRTAKSEIEGDKVITPRGSGKKTRARGESKTFPGCQGNLRQKLGKWEKRKKGKLKSVATSRRLKATSHGASLAVKEGTKNTREQTHKKGRFRNCKCTKARVHMGARDKKELSSWQRNLGATGAGRQESGTNREKNKAGHVLST